MKRCPALLVIALCGPALAAPPPGSLASAEAALARGTPAHAAAIARGLLRARPDDARALKIVALASCMLGDPVAARNAADRLPHLDRLLLAELCARSGVVLPSATDRRLHPLLSQPRARRLYAEAVLRLQRGDPSGAVPLLQRAFRLEPAPQILFEIARCQARAGQLPRAIATHRRYVRTFSDPGQRLSAAARFGELVPRPSM